MALCEHVYDNGLLKWNFNEKGLILQPLVFLSGINW